MFLLGLVLIILEGGGFIPFFSVLFADFSTECVYLPLLPL